MPKVLTPAQQLAKAQRQAKAEALELAMLQQIRGAGLPQPVREFAADVDRKWRFDFAWPAQRVALEVEGGVWTGGRHTRGAGFIADCEKYNHLAIAGWVVLRVAVNHIKSGQALSWIQRAVG